MGKLQGLETPEKGRFCFRVRIKLGKNTNYAESYGNQKTGSRASLGSFGANFRSSVVKFGGTSAAPNPELTLTKQSDLHSLEYNMV